MDEDLGYIIDPNYQVFDDTWLAMKEPENTEECVKIVKYLKKKYDIIISDEHIKSYVPDTPISKRIYDIKLKKYLSKEENKTYLNYLVNDPNLLIHNNYYYTFKYVLKKILELPQSQSILNKIKSLELPKNSFILHEVKKHS